MGLFFIELYIYDSIVIIYFLTMLKLNIEFYTRLVSLKNNDGIKHLFRGEINVILGGTSMSELEFETI